MTNRPDQGLNDTGKGGRFSRLPAAATFDPRLSPAAVRVLAALASYVNPRGQCFPAVGTLAARLGRTRRQVQMHLRTLERAGYLTTTRQKRTRGGGWGVNVYELAYPAVPAPAGESLEATDEGDAPAEGRRADAMQGENSGNGSDAKSDFASDTFVAESDAKSERTGDAKSDFARTSPINSPQGKGRIEKSGLLPDGPAGRFGKAKDKQGASGLADPAQRALRWRQKVMAYMARHLRDDLAELTRSFELIASAPDSAETKALLEAWNKLMRADPTAASADG